MDPHGAAALHTVIDRLQAHVRGVLARKDNSALMVHSLGMMWGREQMARHLQNVNTQSMVPLPAFWRDLAAGGLCAATWKSNAYSVIQIKQRRMLLIRTTLGNNRFRTFQLYPTCERVANDPRLYVMPWKLLPETCDGVIASFLDFGDLHSVSLVCKSFSKSFRSTSPFVDVSALARRRMGYALPRSHAVQGMVYYNLMRGSVGFSCKRFTLLNVARTDTAVEGRILGLFRDPCNVETLQRFVVVTSRGYIGWCVPSSRVFTMDRISRDEELHVRSVSSTPSGALVVSTNNGVIVSSVNSKTLSWKMVVGSAVSSVSPTDSILYIWRGSGRNVKFVDTKSNVVRNVLFDASSGGDMLTSCSFLRACGDGAVCCTGKKSLAFMFRDVAVAVRLAGPGKIVYISKEMPNGEIYVVRAVHHHLRSIDVFKGTVRLRTVTLEGGFCGSYGFSTCGDTIVYYDNTLTPKCVRVRGRKVEVTTSVIAQCPMHTQCKPYLLGANLYTVSTWTRVSLFRYNANTLFDEAKKRKHSAI